ISSSTSNHLVFPSSISSCTSDQPDLRSFPYTTLFRSLKTVVKIKGLKTLTLSRTAVTDKGMEEVASMSGHLLHPLVRDSSAAQGDRKSTRLNSSHVASSYGVFWWKEK